MKKRTLSLILAAAIFGSNVMPSGVWAEDGFYQAATEAELEEIIFSAIQNREQSFKVRYTAADDDIMDEVRSARDKAVSRDPYEEGSISQISGFRISESDAYADISFGSFQYFTTKQQEEFVDQQVAKITAGLLSSGMTEDEKLKTIHDYIIKQVEYDDSLEGYTAYSALTGGRTVCNGYVQLAYRLLECAGVQSKVVKGRVTIKGSTKDHAWLLVKLGGYWYHLDPTLNDTLTGSGSSPYPYYNLSDAEVLVDHNFDQDEYPEAPIKYQLPDENNNGDDSDDSSGGNSGGSGSSGNTIDSTGYPTFKLTGYFTEVLSEENVTAVLDKARMLSVLESDKGRAVIYELEVSAQASSYQVKIPLEIAAKLYSKNPDSSLRVITGLGWYDIPSAELFQSAQSGNEQVNFNITIAKVSEPTARKAAESAAQAGLVPVSDPISFRAELEQGESRVQLVKWNKFVTRSIILKESAADVNLMAAVYNPLTAGIQPVPAVFMVNAGRKIARLPNQNEGIYFAAVGKAPAFTDLAGHWAKDSIERLAAKLIVQGKDPRHFDPESKVTRAEFAAMLVRALGLTDTPDSSDRPKFNDVNNQWYREVAKLAAANGLVNGYSDGSFRPEATITREEMTVMISRAIALGTSDLEVTAADLSGFRDRAAIQTWAQTAVAQLSKAGIVKGNESGEFNPRVSASRAEAVTILDRTLKYLHLTNVDK